MKKWLPLAITILGAAMVAASVPGQGKGGLTALGLALAISGMVSARIRRGPKNTSQD